MRTEFSCISVLRVASGPRVKLTSLFSFTLAYSRFSHEYSSLFIIVINLTLCFRLDALTELGAFMRTDFFMYFCIKSSTGTQAEVS